jgi:hypothetical protein
VVMMQPNGQDIATPYPAQGLAKAVGDLLWKKVLASGTILSGGNVYRSVTPSRFGELTVYDIIVPQPGGELEQLFRVQIADMGLKLCSGGG